MTKQRYAIVRVDINCPKDVCGEEDFCFLSKGKTLADMCDHCEFLQEKRIIGDTKEQLIRKVAQAIKRKLKGGLILRNTKINETYNIQKTISAKAVAKEIVEFVGVK